MRRLKVDMSELTFAMDSNLPEMPSYLDTETGEVLSVMAESVRLAEDYVDEHGEDAGGFEEWFAEESSGECDMDAETAYRIAADSADRYVRVPQADSREGYRDMEAFIETVEDERLRNMLWRAIGGRGAFRMFKDTLIDYPEERERWFSFKDERLKERALEWLESLDIEPEIG